MHINRAPVKDEQMKAAKHSSLDKSHRNNPAFSTSLLFNVSGTIVAY